MSSTLLDAPVVVVSQVGKLASPRAEYDLYDAAGASLGRIEEQASLGSFFARKLATLRFSVTDASGAVVAWIEKPGAITTSTFVVTDAGGHQVGSVEQQNVFFDPQFVVRTETGELHLTSAAVNAWHWQLCTAEGGQVATIDREFAGLADVVSSAESFVVRLGDELTGSSRLVALVSCACLDVVRDIRKERRRN